MKNFLIRHKILTAIVLVIVVFISYSVYRSSVAANSSIRYLTATASKQSLVISVDGTGQVSAVNKIDIKPQSSGTVASVNVINSQTVKTGQIIAMLDQKNAVVAINQAKANLEIAQANYDKLLAGASSPDIEVSKSAVASAEVALSNAQKNLDEVKAQQQVLVNNTYSSLLNSTIAAFPGAANSSTNPVLISGVYNDKKQGQYLINFYMSGQGLRYYVTGLEGGDGLVNTTTPQPLGSKGLYIQFPASISVGDYWTVDIPNTRAANYLLNYNSYQAALQNQIQAIAAAQSSVDSASASLQQTQSALALKQAQARPEDVAVAKAQIANAQTQLQAAQNSYANNIIYAPFDGQVATLNIQKGDQVSMATIVATLVTKENLADISLNEIDVAKVKLGQDASLTFDAVPDLTLAGKVTQIDTVGTVAQGVVSYNVQIGFSNQDSRIKPGMSVRGTITIETKNDVIVVPSSAVKFQNNQSYVETLIPADTKMVAGLAPQVTSRVAPQKKIITTGGSNDTMTEITSGLQEGDTVVTQIINTKPTPQVGLFGGGNTSNQ